MVLTTIVGQERMFVKATGTDENFASGSTHAVERGESYQVGMYATNNGVIAFVDSDKEVWTGRATKEAITALQNAGYRKNSLYVPNSNNCGARMTELAL